MSSPDSFGLNTSKTPDHQIALKKRLVTTGARLMRANAELCPQTRTITTPSERFKICATQVALEMSLVKNAHTDGSTILVTSAMIETLSDDELAFIIAHELAHTVAGHTMALGSTVQAELEADYTAVFLMARANYFLPSALASLRILDVAQQPQTTSHPSGKNRVQTITDAIETIKQQRRQGLNPAP